MRNTQMINWIGLETSMFREIKRFGRVYIQALLTPWINALLFIFIFGSIVGQRIGTIHGVGYIQFVLPGILMMNIISSAFSQTSSSLYFQRFTRHIEEVLVAPLSHLEMILGYIAGALVRSIIVGVLILLTGFFFGVSSISHIGLFFFYIFMVSTIFGLLGLIIALWAEGMEQLSILNTFLITPLSFFGGVFNSIDMLPQTVQTIARFNPFFYFIDGIRYSMVGIHETSITSGVVLMFVLIITLTMIVQKLFASGWKIRN